MQYLTLVVEILAKFAQIRTVYVNDNLTIGGGITKNSRTVHRCVVYGRTGTGRTWCSSGA